MRSLWFVAGFGVGILVAVVITLTMVYGPLSSLADIVYWFRDNVVWGKPDLELIIANSRVLIEKYDSFASTFARTLVALGILGLLIATASGIAIKLRKKRA